MKQNFTCESDSPLIAYTGAWAAHVGNVPGSSNASSAVSMVSETGGMASFNFTGTGIWIYPASNTPRGSYAVYLDGTPTWVPASTGPLDVGIPLFQSSGLQSIPHVLSIHNTGPNGSINSGYLDLAFITWEERDMYGNATGVSIQGDEDTSNAFAWYPFDMWTAETQNVTEDSPGGGQGSSSISLGVHTANASDAWMQYNFSASTVSIYGNVGPTQGPYSVSLMYSPDDGNSTTGDGDYTYGLPQEAFFNASFPFNRTKVLLFHAANINASRATILTLKNHPEKQGDSVSIDYSVISRYVTDSAPIQSSFPVTAMVGSIIGALLMLCLVVVACYFLRRHRQGKLIRRQKTNLFRDLLARRGVLATPEDNDLKKDNPEDLAYEPDHAVTKQ